MPAQIAPNAPQREPQDKQRPDGLLRNVVFFITLAAMIAFMVVFTQPDIRSALGIPISENAGQLAAKFRTNVRITEAMSSNGSTLPNDLGEFSDWIELGNLGTTPESLLGFGLSDRPDRIRFVFPDITLEAGEYLLIYASGVEQAEADAPLHVPFKLSSAGETLYLFNEEGEIIEQVDIPALGRDVSYARQGDFFKKATEPTPGHPNTEEGRAEFLASMTIVDTPLRLNELMASNSATALPGAEGLYVDWIELFNSGDAPIDLSQFALSNDPSKPMKWRFPTGAVIEAHGYYVVLCSGENIADPAVPHTNFKLRAEGGTVLLSDLQGHVLDSATYDNLKSDTVWARPRDWASWTVLDTPTPGASNP